AAEIVSELPQDLPELEKSGEITKIPGIGKGTQALIKEFVETEAVKELDELKKDFPEGILELREVRGLGPKKIKALYEQLQIASLTELEYACEENRLVDLKGFGEKTQTSILKNIHQLAGYKGKVILPVGLQEAEDVKEELESLKGVSRVEPTGDLRRHSEILSSIDFLIEGKAEDALKKAGFKQDRDAWTKASERGIKIKAFTADKTNFGSRWIETTGPEEFVKSLGKISDAATEEDAFGKKPFVHAECRDLGCAGKDLIEEKDIKGVFHLHTNWSDGKNTLEEMVKAAEELGYEYLGLSDHSQTAFYAHGLDEKRVLQQKKEIEAVQKKHPKVHIFHGIESDILADGALDYPNAFLKNFDFVIASVHGQMKMGRADMTKRLVKCLQNPATTWLGHWTGRLLLGREGFDFDMDEVLKVAANEGKAIELNSNPYRLDVDWRILPKLTKLGIPIGIHPDAHSAGGLEDTKYGVWMARKAGLGAKDILNTKSRKEMEAWIAERKRA
ncbi:MAG TPA: PHP domain-containing protein, partial [Bdellovibrionota bacterium]